MNVRSAVRMWKTSLSQDHWQALETGKQVELIVPDGLLLLQMDDTGRLHITWVHQADVEPLRHRG